MELILYDTKKPVRGGTDLDLRGVRRIGIKNKCWESEQMKLLEKLFGKRKEPSPTQRVRGIMQHFVEASHVALDTARFQTPEHGQMYLTYMFGAVDMLCQVNHLDGAQTVTLFQGLLEDLLGGYSPDEAKQLTQIILRASGDPDGQRLMREGGESVRLWIGGAALAPHRLQELLSEIDG